MPITFNQIPSNIRVPLAYIEVDNTRAVSGTPQIMQKILVIGQRLAAGTVAQGVLKRITNDAQPEDFFGRGSMLAEMLIALRKANRALPDFKRLSGVVTWDEAFPRTASMKVKRGELAARVRAELGRDAVVAL